MNFLKRTIAAQISKFTRYYDALVQFMPLEHDSGELLAAIECPSKFSTADTRRIEATRDDPEKRTAILLNGTLNYSFDVQEVVAGLFPALSRSSRVIAVLYNPYFRLLYEFANAMGLPTAPVPQTFLTIGDVNTFARLSGFEVVSQTLCGYCPWELAGIGKLINAFCSILPLFRWLALSSIVTLRPLIASSGRPGLSIVIPARNEFGNIEETLRRMPKMDFPAEIIFVEGHSTDGTWAEIERVRQAYSDRFRILSLQQTGRGKSDAVRLGFSRATMPLLIVLDADLTVPPEMLIRFYAAYADGHGEFVNGSRLVYPMEGGAMRFLNQLGNIFFAKALSYVLNTPLGDSLCGTKLVARHDYQRMVAWRDRFGSFDPFGDFELLFPAAVLKLGIVNIPVRYTARKYGSTNIRRFRHGLQLLRMTVIAFVRIRGSL